MLDMHVSMGSAKQAPVRPFRCSRVKVARRVVRACAQSEDSSDAHRTSKTPDAKATIAGIDALLGIEEEKKEEKEKVDVSVSPNALQSLSEADNMSAATLDSLIRIIGTAKELEANKANNPIEGALREEVERVARSVAMESTVSTADLNIIKKEILGPMSFWVTESVPLEDDRTGGVMLRGNLRAKDASEVFQLLVDGCDQRFGKRYTIYMVQDAMAEDDQRGKPRVAFQVLPSTIAKPAPVAGWTNFAAIILLFLTFGSTMSLGVLAALPKLPPETLTWLSNPESPDFNGVVPGIDAAYDPVPFVSVVATMFLAISGVNVAHELGHRVLGIMRGVKLGPALFVPNGSLGSFGSVTMPGSMIKDRSKMWDVAAAGPLTGLIAGGVLFAYGLSASVNPATDPDLLIPVPSFLFQGSIALGTIAEAVLGSGVAGKVQVHPAVIAGWCTLFTQAFNMLPVGSLDGGRMTQSAFGKSALDWTGVLSYMGLALGVIGSTLSLPFGLFVLLAQRQPEKYLQDQVTGVGSFRETTTTALILLALLILIPFTPDSPDMMDMLPSSVIQTTSSLSV